MTKRTIGIYAGTFDPIHDGHVAFAKAALVAASLDMVVFLPETSPRRKMNVSPISQRIEQISDQVEEIEGLSVAQIDQPQFTINETMPVIDQLFPDSNFSILIGSDLVHQLHYWQQFESIRTKTQFIVGLREGADKDKLRMYLDTLGVSYRLVSTEFGHLSSSTVRGS